MVLRFFDTLVICFVIAEASVPSVRNMSSQVNTGEESKSADTKSICFAVRTLKQGLKQQGRLSHRYATASLSVKRNTRGRFLDRGAIHSIREPSPDRMFHSPNRCLDLLVWFLYI